MTFLEMYEASVRKDQAYEGVFVMAVKSTKIFCRPTCRAKKPLQKNVEFFPSAQEALGYGYRPCKMCKPMQTDTTPVDIKGLISEIQQRPDIKIKDTDLRAKNIDPTRVRRWFQKNHGISFHAYQRLIRINNGYLQIQKGESVIDSAMDTGFDSLSGFNQRFKSVFGEVPSQAKQKNVIILDRFSTVLGPMFVASTSKGVCLLEFTNRRMLENEFKDLQKRCNAIFIPGQNEHIQQAQQELKEYFAGKRTVFSVSLDTPGTAFQQKVWQQLCTIPLGITRSYQEQANAIGNPKAVRAVARANGMNRVAVIIPCHRVIGSDGSLIGYAGGLPKKKWLLEHEQKVKEKQ
ncbi:MAG: methylated-DNA--[protein]-cysteine S-methyltransferase [Bdellovibrionota bacterium]